MYQLVLSIADNDDDDGNNNDDDDDEAFPFCIIIILKGIIFPRNTYCPSRIRRGFFFIV